LSRDEGFDEFVSGASGRLLRTAYLMVGDRAAAEDLLQDVLERMYARWPRIDDPRAYARRALAHAASNRWRSRRRRPEVPLGERDVAAAPPGPEPALRDVLAALAVLPAGQRAVVVLRYFDDLSIEQTAAALGCSVGTVKSQTARALPRLRELLAFAEENC
jgi:RNA polymerase sigma-70 factor (sigma-E family)